MVAHSRKDSEKRRLSRTFATACEMQSLRRPDVFDLNVRAEHLLYDFIVWIDRRKIVNADCGGCGSADNCSEKEAKNV